MRKYYCLFFEYIYNIICLEFQIELVDVHMNNMRSDGNRAYQARITFFVSQNSRI